MVHDHAPPIALRLLRLPVESDERILERLVVLVTTSHAGGVTKLYIGRTIALYLNWIYARQANHWTEGISCLDERQPNREIDSRLQPA